MALCGSVPRRPTSLADDGPRWQPDYGRPRPITVAVTSTPMRSWMRVHRPWPERPVGEPAVLVAVAEVGALRGFLLTEHRRPGRAARGAGGAQQAFHGDLVELRLAPANRCQVRGLSLDE